MSEPPGAAARERLFFALWPNEVFRAQCRDVVASTLGDLPGRRVPESNWHVTLVFLGELDAAQRDCVERCADALNRPAFELEFTELGFFAKAHVVWLGTRLASQVLDELVDDLRRGVNACGITIETRPFAPHLTVVRKVERRPRLPACGPLRWHVDRFALVRSVIDAQGATYDVVRSWPLSAPKSDA